MSTAEQFNYFSGNMSDPDFKSLRVFIHSHTGIKISDAKKGMIEGRLRKRLRKLEIKQYSDYCKYLFSKDGLKNELPFFIDVITTNKTDFFREPAHFEFLVTKAVPDLVTRFGAGVNQKFQVWSAAASTGNEAYTICMVLSEFAEKYPGIGLDFSILATDISGEVLEEARRAIYSANEIKPIPVDLRMKYILKSKDRRKKIVRMAPEIRKRVNFRKLNLMDVDYRFRELMDVIFCRNVIIYFDRNTQDELIMRLCGNLRTGGYLFMGHSEVLHSRGFPLEVVAPSVYRRIE